MKWIGVVLAGTFAVGLSLYVKQRFDQLEERQAAPAPSSPLHPLAAPAPAAPKAAAPPVARWHKIYVPAYTSVLGASDKPLSLEVVLSLRNTSETDPVYFRRIDAYSADGKKVGSFATEALELAVLAAVELTPTLPPPATDAKDSAEPPGPISHFIVEWGAKEPGTKPLIESISLDADRELLARRAGVEVDAGKQSAEPPLPAHAAPLVAKTAPGKPQVATPVYVPVVAAHRGPVLVEKNPSGR